MIQVVEELPISVGDSKTGIKQMLYVAKAFDSRDHSILTALFKTSFRISGPLLRWIATYNWNDYVSDSKKLSF